MAMRHLIVVLVALAVPTTPTPTPDPGSCGKPHYQPENRVIGGKNAKAHSWPWTAALYKGTRFFCGGSLINDRWVVTAAHCVTFWQKNPSLCQVVLGAHNRYDSKENIQKIGIEKVIPHPKYGQLNNDIALIKLKTAAKFGKTASPVCLPNADKDVAVGTNCYITGWGKIKHPGRSHPILQQAVLPLVDSKVCYAKNRKIINIPITDQMLCAGEGGVNPISGCHGDSGGPLVCEVNGVWELHGAVSWGSPRCKSTETYTVFARVHFFRQWIENMMQKYKDVM